ncbi:hypothetical protein BOTNAR_0034g00400 [Botryotinia narcissicola]|uniref:F-box domain-containing protein n=1 Tax=Botryotinia narcissicola TaxID=278944 RepID=A0A4Z1J8M9_9HELO|nr:hypothetical protein BOTNAR_0034g00400 [Botryotinia narcissicola]
MAWTWMSKILKLLPSWVRNFFTSESASRDLVDTQEVTNVATNDSDENSLVANQSPFLRLPLELRMIIYKELSPDLSFKPKIYLRLNRGPSVKCVPVKRFREDGRPCYSAILRLNRQLYHEAIPLWDRQSNKSLANGPSARIRSINTSTVRWSSIPESPYTESFPGL